MLFERFSGDRSERERARSRRVCFQVRPRHRARHSARLDRRAIECFGFEWTKRTGCTSMVRKSSGVGNNVVSPFLFH